MFYLIEETPRVEGRTPVSSLGLPRLLRLQTFLPGQWLAGHGGKTSHRLDTTSSCGKKNSVDPLPHPQTGMDHIYVAHTSNWPLLWESYRRKWIKCQTTCHVVSLTVWCLISDTRLWGKFDDHIAEWLSAMMTYIVFCINIIWKEWMKICYNDTIFVF